MACGRLVFVVEVMLKHKATNRGPLIDPPTSRPPDTG